jgi:hypothetical protein
LQLNDGYSGLSSNGETRKRAKIEIPKKKTKKITGNLKMSDILFLRLILNKQLPMLRVSISAA